VLDQPAAERGHRAVDEALAQGRQVVFDAGRGIGVGTTVDQAVGEEAAQAEGMLRSAGAHVVKAFHMFPAEQWIRPGNGEDSASVAMCGDDPAALEVVGRLARDVGGTPVVLGGLDRARQLEEVAGFVIGLAFKGHDPNEAIPRVLSPIADPYTREA
jgi:predicted dinucleotide-binding enzyme